MVSSHCVKFTLMPCGCARILASATLSRTNSSKRTGKKLSVICPVSAFVNSVKPSTMRASRSISSTWLSNNSFCATVRFLSPRAVSNSPRMTVSGVFNSCEACSVNSRMRWKDLSSREVIQFIAVPTAGQTFAQVTIVLLFHGAGQFDHRGQRAARDPPPAQQTEQDRGQADVKHHFTRFITRALPDVLGIFTMQLLGDFLIRARAHDDQRCR